MKLPWLASLALATAIVPLATAADLPNEAPVNLIDSDPDFDMKCGNVVVKGINVHKAVSYGVSLQMAGATVKCKIYTQNVTNQTAAGADRSVAADEDGAYPHNYRNHEGFEFSHPDCKKQSQKHRQEFPILRDSVFQGGCQVPYKFRAIYVFDPSARGDHPTAIYCGTIYHPGGYGTFQGCDITKTLPVRIWSDGS